MHQKVLSMILVLVMLLGLLSVSAFTMQNTTSSDSADSTEFMRIFHLDCGRKYFSVSDIEGIIDQLAANHYTHLQLAFGNDGLRFLLNDMSLTVNGTEYASDRVTSAIKRGNEKLTSGSSGELSESNMDDIIFYAKGKGIQIIPMFNAPGHMYTAVNAMTSLGINGKINPVSTLYDGRTSNWAVDPTDATAVEFAEALLQKYVAYFSHKGSTMFNIGADESGLKIDTDESGITTTNYPDYAKMVNGMNEIVKNAGMTTLAYNDGIYNTAYAESRKDVKFDNDIVICYWTSGANSASVESLLTKGFKILNNSDNWYYVLGDYLYNDNVWGSGGQWGYKDALNGIKSTPVTQMKDYTGAKKPIGSILCVWCDGPAMDYSSYKTQVCNLIKAMANANPEYFKATGTTPEKPDVNQPTANETVNLTVGGTATRVQKDVNSEGSIGKSDLNENVATVGAKYTQTPGSIIEASSVNADGAYYIRNTSGQYLTSNAQWVADYGTAAQWTVVASSEYYGGTNYYLKNGNSYLAYSRYGGYSTVANTYWASSVSIGSGSTIKINNSISLTACTVTEPVNETVITFRGVAVGTTYVTVGTVRYTIIVNREDLTSAEPLPIQLWITNVSIEVTDVTTRSEYEFNDWGNHGYAQYVTVKADAANNCEEGVPLSDIVPAAIKDKSATTKDDRAATYALWKGTVLNTTTGLQKYWWTDMTMADGRTDYQYVRYYRGAWAVSADRVYWKTVTGDGSTVSSSTCKEQIIAYYMQRTDVTKEVITDVVDWGNVTDKWVDNNPKQYSVLDFAVKYPDGTQVPNTFPEEGKSVYFHCDESDKTGVVHRDDNNNYYRRIGLINGIDTTGYEIYMITVTPTSDVVTDQLTDKNTALTVNTKVEYKGTEKVAWVDDESNLPTQFQSDDAKFTSISGTYTYTVGGNPSIAGLEIYQRQGMLVTYYIRPIVTADSLHVYYVDDTTQEQFYDYAINVNSLYSGDMKFDAGIALNQPAWKGPLKNGTVKNDYNVTQTVSADLSTMPAIDAKYRYAVDYTCVRVERSTDGKSVTLYYTFKTDKTFVVDFGLPLVIQPTDISASLSLAKLTSVTAKSSTKTDYAEIITNSENYNITYKLITMLNGADKLDVKYDGQIPVDDVTQTGSVSYEVGIIPASTVYYEDNFISFEDNDGTWEPVGKTTTNAVQDLDALMAQKIYGYDSHYTSSSAFSLGSAMKTTVSSDTNSNPPKATFTFKGTGFDLVSMTSKDTGTILVDVDGTTENNETVTKRWIVDTFYGYKRELAGYIQYNWTLDKDGKTWHNTAEKIPALPEGATTGGTPVRSGDTTYEPNYIWKTADEGDNALYQIPVIHYTDLPYGEYTVTVTPKYSRSRDPYYNANGDNNSYDFYLDGVRIYNPAGDKLNSQYVLDGEGYAQFTEIRNMLIAAKNLKLDTSASGMVFVDGVRDTSEITDYTNYGPNNEVYLSSNQAIAFKISNMSNVDSIQIGAKAPKGDTTMKIQVNGNAVQTQPLTTASDMYYKLENVQPGQTIVITNAGDHLLSLTTLKVTYQNEPSASNSADPVVDEEVVAQAPVMLMSMLYGEPQTFAPSRFEASWNRSVRAGHKATLTVKTSDDVEAIEVNGEKIDTYRTRTERTGWGPSATKVTYHVFTYQVKNAATATYSICAVNADGVVSDPITATLTVRPSIRDWWNGIFDKWKH